MTFEATLREYRVYRATIEAPSESHAEQQMRVLVADRELDPDTCDVQVDAYADLYCEACGRSHFGPSCPMPHASDCAYWVSEECDCVIGGSHDLKIQRMLS